MKVIIISLLYSFVTKTDVSNDVISVELIVPNCINMCLFIKDFSAFKDYESSM